MTITCRKPEDGPGANRPSRLSGDTSHDPYHPAAAVSLRRRSCFCFRPRSHATCKGCRLSLVPFLSQAVCPSTDRPAISTASSATGSPKLHSLSRRTRWLRSTTQPHSSSIASPRRSRCPRPRAGQPTTCWRTEPVTANSSEQQPGHDARHPPQHVRARRARGAAVLLRARDRADKRPRLLGHDQDGRLPRVAVRPAHGLAVRRQARREVPEGGVGDAVLLRLLREPGPVRGGVCFQARYLDTDVGSGRGAEEIRSRGHPGRPGEEVIDPEAAGVCTGHDTLRSVVGIELLL